MNERAGYTTKVLVFVDTIDGWLAWLEKNTPMRLAHSSGTSGKLSFFPRSTDDMPMLVKGIFKAYEGIGDVPKNDLFNSGKDMVFVFAGFRGGNTIPRFMMDGFASMVTGREDSVIALYPSSMSADVLSLQGRVKTAAAAGRLNELKISPGLLARRDELTALFKNRPQQIRDFVDHYRKHYGDRKAIVMGHWTTYLELKTACEEMGFTHLFAPGSVVTGGGGSKGQTLPDGYVETVADFMGIDWLRQFYGMTEINGWARQCPNRQYHIPPYTIPFLLDPDSGEPLPRTGRQTGRFSFLDLLAKTCWGGCISGDELLIEWDKPCGCGRGNPYISAPIQRYSEMQEGDDKISCAGAHNAHEDALNFLAELKAA